MTNPEAITSPAPPKRGWKRLFTGRFLVISIAVHLLFGGGAAVWIVQTSIEQKRQEDFRSSAPSTNPSQHATEHKVQMVKKQQTMSAPPSMKRVTVNAPNAQVTLPSMPTMPSNSTVPPTTMAGMSGVGGFGFGRAGGSGGGGGGGAPINFFGFRTNAKRIAFLMDYSGSMSGEFRTNMERNLEDSLKKLPAGTEILIIPWAGPAWLYNQTAKQIASKWKMVDQYDNFTLVPGATIDPPKWVLVNSSNSEDIMRGIRAQQNAPGGTDWRQPFRYAMQAQPAPDVIFFMTDGQIPASTAPRALADIDAALKKSDHVPQVNCLWIENKHNKPDHLRQLAARYHGEFQSVAAK